MRESAAMRMMVRKVSDLSASRSNFAARASSSPPPPEKTASSAVSRLPSATRDTGSSAFSAAGSSMARQSDRAARKLRKDLRFASSIVRVRSPSRCRNEAGRFFSSSRLLATAESRRAGGKPNCAARRSSRCTSRFHPASAPQACAKMPSTSSACGIPRRAAALSSTVVT